MPPLPTHHTPSSKLRFTIQSLDVLQQMRINITEENSDQILWYKERFLSDNEIIENVVHNPSNTICWSIHKPKRGWYIRLRHSSFPPGTYIPFLPVPPSSPYYVEAALSFNSRTNGTHASTPQISTLDDDARSSSSSSVHSYPPTPTIVASSPPPNPNHVPINARSPSASKTSLKVTSRPSQPTKITQFVLAPHSVTPQVPTSDTFFSRALSMIQSHRPSHSKSFTLSRVPESPPSPPPPPYTSQITVVADDESRVGASSSPLPLKPFLVHHDRTPLFTVGSFTGLIELDAAEERMLGVDRSFWIAVALTYLEFLENRESYLAASSD